MAVREDVHEDVADKSAGVQSNDSTTSELRSPLRELIDSVLERFPAAMRTESDGKASAIMSALEKAGIVNIPDLEIMLEHDYTELKAALKGTASPLVIARLKLIVSSRQQKAIAMRGRVLRAKSLDVCSILLSNGLPDSNQPDLLTKVLQCLDQSNHLTMFVLLILSTLKSAEYTDFRKGGDAFIGMSVEAAARVDKSLRACTFACAISVLVCNSILRDLFSACQADKDAKMLLENSPRWVLCLPTYALKASFLLVALLFTWHQILKAEWIVFLSNQLFLWLVLIALPLIISKAIAPAAELATNRHRLSSGATVVPLSSDP